MGISLLAGRLFVKSSVTETRSEIVVNRAFVRQYWPNGNALGKRIYLNTPKRDWTGEIVGVVEDVPQWSLEIPPLPEVYQPSDLTRRATRHLIIRTGLPSLALARAVREAVGSIDAGLAVSGIRTMDAVLENAAARRRFNTVLIETFAGLALIMVSVGVYGVICC